MCLITFATLKILTQNFDSKIYTAFYSFDMSLSADNSKN